MEQKIKILVSGDVQGRFKQLFNRVDSINKKAGPFEILLCVGEFFGSNNDELVAYKNGFKHISVPTYILGPNTKETAKFYENIEDGDICSNLTYLGKRGLYTLSSGVKIVYLSGVEGSGENKFQKDDIVTLRNSCLVNKNSTSDYKGVDILVTSQWPHGIGSQEKNTSKLISYLSREIKPRYHFCGMNGIHTESPPYRIPADSTTQLELSTRFISLADVGNAAKQKYIYALSVSPVEKMRVLELIQKTTNETTCPFDGMDFSDCKAQQQMDDGKQYFYDMNTNSNDNRKRGGHRGLGYNGQEKRQRVTIDQEKCWFCLSSANVEKHLVITIGDNFYLALAKGPINEYHILILSVTHIQSSALLSNEDWKELTKFKEAIRKFFKQQGQVVCFTERNYKASHLQINALGLSEGYAWKIKHGFEDKAEEYNITLETLPELEEPSTLPQQGPFFVAELPDRTTLLTRQMKQFPLHFAREVFCSENLLNCDEKTDWKDCSLTKDEEIELVKQFRAKFKEFDFTQ